VLRFAPADASWVVAASRVGDAVGALREAGELAAAVQGARLADLDAAARAAFGLSPMSPDDLAAAGIRLDASAAIFGQAGFPTALLPVADADRLRRFLDGKRPELGAEVASHRGHQIVSWSQGGVAASWVVLDGWLVLRAAPASAGRGWLDQILAAPAGGSLGSDPDLAEVARRGEAALGAPPGVLALARFDRLAREIEDWKGAAPPRTVSARDRHQIAGDDPVGLPEVSLCARALAGAAARLVGAARLEAGAVDSWAALDLAPGAAGALRDHTGPPAPGGYYAYRAKAPLAVLLAVALPWLEKVRAAAGCPLLDRPIRDPVRAMTGMSGPRAIYAAATRIDIDDLDGGGALHMVLTDQDLVTAQLESIPGRSLFERKRTIAGRSVRSLSVPGLPAILYLQEGRRFTVALGGDAMGAVLGSGAAPERPELAAVRIEPGRLRNLGRLVAAAVRAANLPAGAAASLTEALRRVERASLVVELEADSLVMRAGMRLRK
jgi:hypothetical protein